MKVRLMNGSCIDNIKKIMLGKEAATIYFNSGVVDIFYLEDINTIEDVES